MLKADCAGRFSSRPSATTRRINNVKYFTKCQTRNFPRKFACYDALMRVASRTSLFAVAWILLTVSPHVVAESPVNYRVTFPAPEHHYAEIEVTFPNVAAGALEARMSRSSPGRYALHEFSK